MLSFLHEKSVSNGISRVYAYLSAISYHHRRVGEDSPCDNIRVKMLMKGLKRQNKTVPVKRARPITVEMLENAVRHLDNEDSIVVWRTVWRMVVSFSCFLRWDDIRRLQVNNLTLHSNENGPFYRLELIGGKTNQTNAPSHRIIAQTQRIVCPYSITQR